MYGKREYGCKEENPSFLRNVLLFVLSNTEISKRIRMLHIHIVRFKSMQGSFQTHQCTDRRTYFVRVGSMHSGLLLITS